MSSIVVSYPTYTYPSKIWPIFLFLALFSTGCLPGGYRDVPKTEDPESLRTFLAENPDHPQAPELKRRVEELEAEKALADGSTYALHSFLSRYPASASAVEVREKLQQLDWQKAAASDREQDWNNFLVDWPTGSLADQARARLAEKKCERLLSKGSLEELEAAARSERLACRSQLRERAMELRYLQAADSPCCAALLGFLRRYGQTTQARQLRRLLAGWRVGEFIQAARFELAQQLAEKYSLGEEVYQRIRHSSNLWHEALALVPPGWREDFSDAAEVFDPPRGSCARQLWARELSRLIDERAAQALFDLLDDSFLEVRREAVLGLHRVVVNLGRARAAGWLDDKFSQLDEPSAPPLRVAVLRWLAGEGDQALSLLRAVGSQSAYGDVFALWLTALISSEIAGRRVATPAEEFQSAASAFASGRMKNWDQDRQRDKNAAASVLRQLCALARLWREAVGQQVQSYENGQDTDQLTLDRLERWIEEKEKTIEGFSPPCLPCLGELPLPEEKWRISPQQIGQLALTPSAWTTALLDNMACSHPGEQLRRAAFYARALGMVLAPALGPFSGHAIW